MTSGAARRNSRARPYVGASYTSHVLAAKINRRFPRRSNLASLNIEIWRLTLALSWHRSVAKGEIAKLQENGILNQGARNCA